MIKMNKVTLEIYEGEKKKSMLVRFDIYFECYDKKLDFPMRLSAFPQLELSAPRNGMTTTELGKSHAWSKPMQIRDRSASSDQLRRRVGAACLPGVLMRRHQGDAARESRREVR